MAEAKRGVPDRAGPAMVDGRKFLGVRDAKKVAGIFGSIEEYERAAACLVQKTARAYYDAGNILAAVVRKWNYKKDGRLSARAVAEASGFPERRVTLALKIFGRFENNPGALDGLGLRDAVRLIAPPPAAGEDGCNRIDLGGDPGQMEFDFEGLFKLPPAGNRPLKNYRTVGDLISEILVVHRNSGGLLTSRRFAHFCEDVPRNPALLRAYKTMSQKTQAAVEDYLAAVEQEEDG